MLSHVKEAKSQIQKQDNGTELCDENIFLRWLTNGKMLPLALGVRGFGKAACTWLLLFLFGPRVLENC